MSELVLDLDMGVDDALALGLVLRSPEVEVLGVSTVCGNVPLERAERNALQVLALLGRADIPVYAGATRPLVREPVHAFEVHGEQGLGRARLPEPEEHRAGDAVDFLLETLARKPGEVVLVAAGPLTNLALAEKRRPGSLRKARRIIVMGGALAECGNVTPVSEFNFYADPHAARQVVGAGANLTLVPLDATHKVLLEDRVIGAYAGVSKDPFVGFLVAATRTAIDHTRQVYGCAGIHLHDPLAAALAIDASLCRLEVVRLEVETQGDLCAGQVVVDRRPFLREGDRTGWPVECAVDVDVERFMSFFVHRLLGGPKA